MKTKYETPVILVETLEAADVLMVSEEKDNKYLHSKSILNNFRIDDIL